MGFLTDKQTHNDLEIYGPGSHSIFKIFDRAVSFGGKQELLDMFHNPLSGLNEIKERQEIIRYICRKKVILPIDKHLLDFIESYLLMGNKPNRVTWFNAYHKSLKYSISPTNESYIIRRGIRYVIEFLQDLYVQANTVQDCPELLRQHFGFISNSIGSGLGRVLDFNARKKIHALDLERFDHMFRYCHYEQLKDILQIVYTIDAYQAVAEAANELGLVFPEISDQPEIRIEGLYHPFLKNAVINDIMLGRNSNLFFVTGANMAGKSTFLKAFGIAVYLAHLGFPVNASSMESGVFNGLFTTINMGDSLNKGYSHFYSEVLRIKEVAKEISRSGQLVVIFDELFRGTNVKDAYDASLAIISAFAKIPECIFIVSTHIMEVAHDLRHIPNIRFGYFDTSIVDKIPRYSYKLKEGVSPERLGMVIIENEEIIRIIESCRIQ